MTTPTFELGEVPASLRDRLARDTDLHFGKQGATSTVAFVQPDDLVLKRATETRYRRWLRHERAVLVALAPTRIPTPEVVDFVDDESGVWLLMTRVVGTTCAAAVRDASAVDAATVFTAIGAAARELHDTPTPEAIAVAEPWIARMLAETRANIEDSDGTLEQLVQLEAQTPPGVAPRLIHGDLNLENVMVERGRVTGLVDWSGGGSGDPRYDVAVALRTEDDFVVDASMRDAFFAGYGSRLSEGERRWFEGLYDF